MSKVIRLTQEQEQEYLRIVHDPNETQRNKQKATDKLINGNMYIVDYAINKFYKNISYELREDIRQEGAIGLDKAIKKFDLSKDVRFSTYAIWWIRQTINKSLSDTLKTIRTPVYVGEVMQKITKMCDEIYSATGREATDEELSAELGYSPRRIAEFRKAMLSPSTLDFEVGDDTQLSDMVEDENAINPEDAQMFKDISSKMSDIFVRLLNPREEYVIRLRQGIGTVDVHTLEEVGAKLNLTKERIRQIENQAMEKLKRSPEIKSFKNVVLQSQ